MNKKENILIVGAGLCGSLLALRLAQRGYHITLVEKRPDLRKVELDAGRSINLALSDRGLRGLRLGGVEQEARKLCIPMEGRMIHHENGKVFLTRYSGRDHEHINSVSRPGLNMLLLDACEKMPNVKMHFDLGCEDVDLKNASATFKNSNTGEQVQLQGDILFGTDGAGSVIRKSMFLNREFLFSFSQNWLTHGYKEITIPCSRMEADIVPIRAPCIFGHEVKICSLHCQIWTVVLPLLFFCHSAIVIIVSIISLPLRWSWNILIKNIPMRWLSCQI